MRTEPRRRHMRLAAAIVAAVLAIAAGITATSYLGTTRTVTQSSSSTSINPTQSSSVNIIPTRSSNTSTQVPPTTSSSNETTTYPTLITTSTFTNSTPSRTYPVWPSNALANSTLSSPQVQAFIKNAYSYNLVAIKHDPNNYNLTNVILNVARSQTVKGNWTSGYDLSNTGVSLLNITVQRSMERIYGAIDLGPVTYKAFIEYVPVYSVIQFGVVHLPDQNESVTFTANDMRILEVAFTNSTVEKMLVGLHQQYYVSSVGPWAYDAPGTFLFEVRLSQANGTQGLDIFVDTRLNSVANAFPESRIAISCISYGGTGTFTSYCITNPWTPVVSQVPSPPQPPNGFSSGQSENATLTEIQVFPFIKSAYNYTIDYVGLNSTNTNYVTIILTVTGNQVVTGDWTEGYRISYTGITILNVTAQVEQPYGSFNMYNFNGFISVGVIKLPNLNQSITFQPKQQQAIRIALSNSTVQRLIEQSPYYVQSVAPFQYSTSAGDYQLVQLYQVNGDLIVNTIVNGTSGNVLQTYLQSRGFGLCWGDDGVCLHDPWVRADIPEPPYLIDVSYPGQWTMQVKEYGAGAALPHYLSFSSNYTGTGNGTISVPFVTTTGGTTIVVTVQKLDGSSMTLTASLRWDDDMYPGVASTSDAYGSVKVSEVASAS